MSEYTEFNYAIRPSLSDRAMASAAGLADLLTAGAAATAASVAELSRRYQEAQTRLAATGLERGQARLAALDEVPLLKAAALAEAHALAPATLAARGGLDRLAGLPAARIDASVSRGLARLRQVEAGLVQTAVREALQDMGYHIAGVRQLAPGQTSLRANHENGTGVVVRLDARRGRGALDLSGFAPGVCVATRRDLQDRLARRGVALEVASAVRHDAREGGCLAAEEARETAREDTRQAAHAPPARQPLPQRQR